MTKPSLQVVSRAIGRTFLGAIAGFFLGPMIGFLLLLSGVLHSHLAPNSKESADQFMTACGAVGALLGAVFGLTVGAKKIRGPAMTTVAGLLIGAALGALVVAPLGKFGLLIMPFSAALGGLFGAAFAQRTRLASFPSSRARRRRA